MKKRNSKYETHILPNIEAIAAYARCGVPDETIAKKLKVSPTTFKTYKKKHRALSEILKTSKELADKEIENRAYHMAHGFYVTVKKPIKRRIREYSKETGKCIREEEVIDYADDEQYISPNPQILQFWLCNRNKDEWKPSGKILVSEADGISLFKVQKDIEE